MNNLDDFLKNHIPGDNQPTTHTRIPGGVMYVPGGKYFIPKEDYQTFYKLYHKKVFIDKQYEHLVEIPNKNKFPILIDLDFRYNKEVEERPHNDEHIIDIIHVYLQKLHDLLQITDGTQFPIYVFEKPTVNTLPDITKDGIHIIIGITMDSVLQFMLRDKVVDDIKDIVSGLNCVNDIHNIVDKCVSRGTQGWQMYGSRKPDCQAYKLVHYYNAEWEGGEWSDLDEVDISNYDTLELLLKVSAQKEDHICYEINDDIKESYEKSKKNVLNKVIKPAKPSHHYGYVDYSKITNKEALEGGVQELLDSLKSEEYNIREIHDFTMILSEKYYNDYDDWLRVGFALHNTDKRMFLTWMLFSSQSDKFDFGEITNNLEIWHGMRNGGLTERSIIYWAKESNIEEYNKIQQETINYYVDKSIDKNTDHNLAFVLYKMFEGKFICASIKNKVWYEFKNHKWEEVDSGTTLRNHITKKVSTIYDTKIATWKDLMVIESQNTELQGSLNKKIGIALQIIMKMGNVDGKNRIMREAQELFYNKNFFEKLDAHPYLLHFTNGVIDFEANSIKNIFRDGKPTDYISLSTRHEYIPYDHTNKEDKKNKKEIDTFFRHLFTNDELRRYMLEHLASTLIGTNENETFNIYNGVGRNGKSKLVDLMGKVLGELKGVVPLSLVTRKREGSGKASPELARLRGVRYAVMQEPSKNDRINEGQMKELTGGDAIQARALFRDPIEFKPQFKLAVCTNNLFDVPSNDDGTWRRIRVCEFLSKFCNDPSPDSKDKEFKGIFPSKLLAKFDKWLPVFTTMLVNIAYKTQGGVKDCEMVMLASKRYRGSQDYLGKFFDDNIIKSDIADNRQLKFGCVWEEFKSWYTEEVGRNLPKRGELKNFMEKKLGLYPKTGWRNYAVLQYSG